MTTKEYEVLIEGLRILSADAEGIASALASLEKGGGAKGAPAQDANGDHAAGETSCNTTSCNTTSCNTTSCNTSSEAENTKAPKPEAKKAPSMEEVRAVLAEKSREGYRKEVKALLLSRGAEKLSEITDPEVLFSILKEAEGIGHA